MAKAEFENGIPRTDLEENKGLLEALQTYYGNFAYTVLHEVKQTDPTAPDDIVTFGNNWLQLVVTRNKPNNDLEEMMLQQNVTTFFGDMWPIFIRRSDDDIFSLMQAIQTGVRTDSLDKRILTRLAVLDITSINPPIRERDLIQSVDTPWGKNGVLRGSGTCIYHITSGFARQTVQDIVGSPGDDFSASLFRPGSKKWL